MNKGFDKNVLQNEPFHQLQRISMSQTLHILCVPRKGFGSAIIGCRGIDRYIYIYIYSITISWSKPFEAHIVNQFKSKNIYFRIFKQKCAVWKFIIIVPFKENIILLAVPRKSFTSADCDTLYIHYPYSPFTHNQLMRTLFKARPVFCNP